MRRYWLIIIIVCALCGCARKAVICGVPYSGCTPWQLVASIQTDGDGTFIVESVNLITETKAYISGYLLRDTTGALLPDELPATLICDLSDKGEVCGSVIHCENNEKQ